MDRSLFFYNLERIYEMTLPTQPERGSEQPGEGLPIPKLETPSQSSPSSVDTDAIARQVEEKLRREIRQAQSMRDRETAAANKKLSIDDLSELEAMGVTIPENVKTEYRFRQLETPRSTENSPVRQAPSPGNGAELTAAEVSEVVKSYQLDANQADVLEALRGTYRNRDHFEATMARLAVAKSRPTGDAADSASMSTRTSTPPDKATEIENGYQEEIRKVPRGNINAAAQVKAKWRKIARENGLQLNV